jgi:hypothetical protein
MNSQFSGIIASERVADLRRDADREHLRRSVSRASARVDTDMPVLALRLAGSDERPAVGRLAQLDSASTLEGEVMFALLDGEPVAAISLDDGRVVANPFVPTSQAVALLRLRADQLRVPSRRRGLRTLLRPRMA